MSRLFILVVFFYSALVSADDNYLTNDISNTTGNIDTKRHVYYPGDSIDIRISLKDAVYLSNQGAELYLIIYEPNGYVSYQRIENYGNDNSKRVAFIESYTSNQFSEGVYQIGLLALNPGGNPNMLSDWYNGLSGLMDKVAILISSTPVNQDGDRDGYFDNDFDDDGYLGDDESLSKSYYQNNGMIYKSEKYREWGDDDWDDDEDSDWDDPFDSFSWDDDDDEDDEDEDD